MPYKGCKVFILQTKTLLIGNIDLNGVSDVGHHLDRLAEVVPTSLLADHMLVDFSLTVWFL